MIKANELRIGNWVYADDSDIWIDKAKNKPIQITIDDFEDTEHMYPIRLTPEILEKAGFVKHISIFDTIYFDINLNKYDYLRLIPDDESCICSLNDAIQLAPYMKHLHQLQNLYFALTGEELNINLP